MQRGGAIRVVPVEVATAHHRRQREHRERRAPPRARHAGSARPNWGAKLCKFGPQVWRTSQSHDPHRLFVIPTRPRQRADRSREATATDGGESQPSTHSTWDSTSVRESGGHKALYSAAV